ncbi:T9SS type A sorting domain-containing protein [candidate division KSB1 bacterium]|nr:T9SS type A sorting domain-containing protein [candidate division KSB1 bacterium]
MFRKNLIYLAGLILALGQLPSAISFGQQVTLGWSPSHSTRISHYGIYRSNHPDSSFQLLRTVTHPETIYVDAAVRINQHYYYAATAFDFDGNESGFSNMVDTTIRAQTPVELSTFSATTYNADVLLVWTTATESQNYGFEIQRSDSNSQNFKKIAFVMGKGTTANQTGYQYRDQGLLAGYYEYRLKQLDFNGDYAYSAKLRIAVQVPGEFQLHQNYPNPFNKSTHISYTLPEKSLVKLTIYDVNGKMVKLLVHEIQEPGQFHLTWNGADTHGQDVASGNYYFKIETAKTSEFRKMIYIK